MNLVLIVKESIMQTYVNIPTDFGYQESKESLHQAVQNVQSLSSGPNTTRSNDRHDCRCPKQKSVCAVTLQGRSELDVHRANPHHHCHSNQTSHQVICRYQRWIEAFATEAPLLREELLYQTVHVGGLPRLWVPYMSEESVLRGC